MRIMRSNLFSILIILEQVAYFVFLVVIVIVLVLYLENLSFALFSVIERLDSTIWDILTFRISEPFRTWNQRDDWVVDATNL